MTIFAVVPSIGAGGHIVPLSEHLARCCAETVIFDNGMPLDVRSQIPPGAHVVDADDMNLHQMWNAGLDRFDGRDGYVAVLNDDLRIGPTALRDMARHLDANPDVAVVGPSHDGDEHAVATVGHHAEGLPGWCFMLRDLGYRFPVELKWWFGDNDMVATLTMRGWHIATIGADVEHIDGGSQSSDWPDDLTRGDREWFVQKWGPLNASIGRSLGIETSAGTAGAGDRDWFSGRERRHPRPVG